jgi:hypothetical protein
MTNNNQKNYQRYLQKIKFKMAEIDLINIKHMINIRSVHHSLLLD